MELPLRIELQAPDLEFERNFEVKFNFITLGPELFLYDLAYTSEMTNEATKVWEPRFVFRKSTYTKQSLTGIDIRYWGGESDVYSVSLDFLGVADTWHTYYKKKSEAMNLYRKIVEWRHGVTN